MVLNVSSLGMWLLSQHSVVCVSGEEGERTLLSCVKTRALPWSATWTNSHVAGAHQQVVCCPGPGHPFSPSALGKLNDLCVHWLTHS